MVAEGEEFKAKLIHRARRAGALENWAKLAPMHEAFLFQPPLFCHSICAWE